MPNFTFTSPDGRQVTVTGPEGATVDQAFAIAQQQLQATAQNKGARPFTLGGQTINPGDDPANIAARDMSGYDKFAVPVGAALLDTGRALKRTLNLGAGALSPGGMAAAQTENQADTAATANQEQPARDAAAAANPRSYYGLYAPTSVLSMAPLGEGVGTAGDAAVAGMPAATTALGRAAMWAAPKALQGATYGAQSPGDTATNIAAGAVLGPATDAAFTGLGKAASAIGDSISSIKGFGTKLFAPSQAARQTVQDIIENASTGTAAGAPEMSGVSLTQGGSTLDPGLQSLEQAVRQRVSGNMPNEAVFQAQQRANNEAILGGFKQMAATDTPLAESSTAAHEALTAAQEARAAQEKELWGAVPLNTQVDAAKTSAAIDSYINGQTVTNQRIIQRSAGDFLDDFRAAVSKYADEGEDGTQVTMPFGEIKDLRSTLGQSIRDAQKSGNSNAVRLLTGMDNKLLGTLGDENALLGAPEATGALGSAQAKLAKMNGTVTAQDLGDAYNAARGFTADTHGTYFTKPVQGFLDQDPAKMLDSVTRTPENLKAYLNAASQAPDGGAKAVGALRDYLLSKGIGNASMSARGGTTPFLNGQSLGDWLGDNQGVLGQVFNADELGKMKGLADASYRNIASEAASPRLGSTTINNLFKNQNVSTQIAPGLPGQNTLVMKAGTGILNKMLGKYSDQTESLLRDAMLDPTANAALFQPRAPAGPGLAQLLAQGAGSAKAHLPDPKGALIRYLLQAQPQQ